jgi:hypothetical protein
MGIPKLLGARYPPTGVHSWPYLFRILCRPFWRSLPLLRTDYTASLRRNSVQCGNARSSLCTLQEAARRIRTFFPSLDFLCSVELTEQNQGSLFESDYSAFLSCVRFGVDGNWVAARIFAHAKECTESRHEKRFFTLIGRLFDDSEFKSRFARIRADLSKKKDMARTLRAPSRNSPRAGSSSCLPLFLGRAH